MSKSVNKAYSDIYRHYDLVIAIFSFGTMKLWRKIAAKEAIKDVNKCALLDIATGTGELAFEIIKAAGKNNDDISITATDFNSKMLEVAKGKAKEKKLKIRFQLGDAEDLKYADNSFDVVTSGFALKHIDDLPRFCGEVRRVLKRNGRFVFLDMAEQDNRFGRLLIGAYWFAISRILSVMVGKDSYVKIIGSIGKFDKYRFVETLKRSGFKQVKINNLVFGPAFLITGRK